MCESWYCKVTFGHRDCRYGPASETSFLVSGGRIVVRQKARQFSHFWSSVLGLNTEEVAKDHHRRGQRSTCWHEGMPPLLFGALFGVCAVVGIVRGAVRCFLKNKVCILNWRLGLKHRLQEAIIAFVNVIQKMFIEKYHWHDNSIGSFRFIFSIQHFCLG